MLSFSLFFLLFRLLASFSDSELLLSESESLDEEEDESDDVLSESESELLESESLEPLDATGAGSG